MAEAANKLEAMLQGARTNYELLQGIAQESRAQAGSIEEVSVAVRTLDEMTQHNAALVEETSAAIEQTEAQAQQLDRIVDVFTLAEAGGMTVRRAAWNGSYGTVKRGAARRPFTFQKRERISAKSARTPHKCRCCFCSLGKCNSGEIAFGLISHGRGDISGAQNGAVAVCGFAGKSHFEDRTKVEAIKRSQAVIEFGLDGTILKANGESARRGQATRSRRSRAGHHRMFVEPAYAASPEYAEFWRALGAGSFRPVSIGALPRASARSGRPATRSRAHPCAKGRYSPAWNLPAPRACQNSAYSPGARGVGRLDEHPGDGWPLIFVERVADRAEEIRRPP